MALYGHLIDERNWDLMPDLFTTDVVYDMSTFGLGRVQGISAVRQLWIDNEQLHPLAHHATNILISTDGSGTVRVLSKGLGVGRNGRVGSVVYRDIVRREPAGWRIAERVGVLRTAVTSSI